MIKETKVIITTETIHDNHNYGLSITRTDRIVTEIKLIELSQSEQKTVLSITNKDKELGNFLVLMKQYLTETKSI